MSETKHTPGPWIASQPAMGFSDIRQKSTGKLVFAVAHPSTNHGEGEISDEEKYANLALLAAAPGLLSACKTAKAHLVNTLTEPGRTVFWILVEAIAKAEGRE